MKSKRTVVIAAMLVAAIALLVRGVLPGASGATKVVYQSGVLACEGTMKTSVLNTTGSPVDASVVVHTASGSFVSASGGNSDMEDIPTNSALFATHDCSSGSEFWVQVTTPSTAVVPSIAYTPFGGQPENIPAGAWRMKVRR